MAKEQRAVAILVLAAKQKDQMKKLSFIDIISQPDCPLPQLTRRIQELTLEPTKPFTRAEKRERGWELGSNPFPLTDIAGSDFQLYEVLKADTRESTGSCYKLSVTGQEGVILNEEFYMLVGLAISELRASAEQTRNVVAAPKNKRKVKG